MHLHYFDCNALRNIAGQDCDCSATADFESEKTAHQETQKYIDALCRGVDADTSRESWPEAIARVFNNKSEQLQETERKLNECREERDKARLLVLQVVARPRGVLCVWCQTVIHVPDESADLMQAAAAHAEQCENHPRRELTSKEQQLTQLQAGIHGYIADVQSAKRALRAAIEAQGEQFKLREKAEQRNTELDAALRSHGVVVINGNYGLLTEWCTFCGYRVTMTILDSGERKSNCQHRADCELQRLLSPAQPVQSEASTPARKEWLDRLDEPALPKETRRENQEESR